MLLHLLAACTGAGGGDPVGYTLELEPLSAGAPSGNAIATTRIVPFGDTLVAFGSEVSRLEGGAWVSAAPLDHALGGAVLDGTIYALTGGGVASSADGVTFTPVSDRPLTGIAAVGGGLLGVEAVDGFSMQVVRSTDRGASWTSTGVVVTYTILELGTFDAFFVGGGPDTAFARFVADADLGDNVDLLTEVWALEASGTGQRVATSLLEPVPVAITADAVAVVDLGAAVNTLNDPYHRLTVAFSEGYDPTRAAEDYTRVHVVASFEPIAPLTANLMGVDGDGALLLGLGDGVWRSTTAVGPDGDQSDALALGPGCDDWIDRAKSDDDQPTVTVANASAEPLRIRTIDPLNRWSVVAEVAPGATATVTGSTVREQSLLMAVGADGACLGVFAIPDKAPSDLTWTVDAAR